MRVRVFSVAIHILLRFIEFDRTQFRSRGFYDVLRVLIADVSSLQALAAILDFVKHQASLSCWYRSDARQDERRLSQAALFSIWNVRGNDHVCSRWSAKKHANTS